MNRKHDVFRFRVEADSQHPLFVVIEPSGMVIELDEGDHVTVELPAAPGIMETVITHSPERLTISEPGGTPAKVWDSSGKQVW
ncbi:hypothetical protein ACIQV3_32725 [Streptomyces sp. NPDC099050]|uniref:hypothetical protein n=1 Tax=Streptomyces sp. NPDC099050 TaxID=3366100 RepID=UPI0037F2DA26